MQFFETRCSCETLVSDVSKPPAVAAAAGAGAGGGRVSSTSSSHRHDAVNASQFVLLLDQFLADNTDQQLTRQLMTFVCEGFVLSKDERVLRRQQVTTFFVDNSVHPPIHLTLPEAADLTQNRPLWRMMSTHGATQS